MGLTVYRLRPLYLYYIMRAANVKAETTQHIDHLTHRRVVFLYPFLKERGD
nr:MAG TPA: hypothetical protein [Caudoviricetes sp.]